MDKRQNSATFPLDLNVSQSHTLSLETIGDTMRATVDGKPVAFLQSSGIGHPTKSKIEIEPNKDGKTVTVTMEQWLAEEKGIA